MLKAIDNILIFSNITTSVRRDLLAYVSCMDYILKRAKQRCIGKACLSDTVSFFRLKFLNLAYGVFYLEMY